MIADHIASIESRRQEAQAAIDAARSSAERNRLGQFATPMPLAVDIARYVLSVARPTGGRFCFADPAVGTGSFYSAALSVFGPERLESALGVDLDPVFADAARDLWGGAGLEVIQGDFTRLIGEGLRAHRPNLILANPPYVRHHHLDRSEKTRLQRLVHERAGVEVNGLAGLYVYFLLLATSWMEDDGIAAWLIPSEFMGVNYGASLRRFLTDRVTLIRVHRFDPAEVQFEDALVSSVVVVFRKAPPGPRHACEFTFGGSLIEPHVHDLVAPDDLREARKWTAFPAHAGNGQAAYRDNGPMLRDLFRIQRGIATGDNGFFILDRAEAMRRGLPATFLRPILPSPRHLKVTVIDADDDGYPRLVPQLCLIDCDLPEHVVQRRFPSLWAYLGTAEALGVKDGYLVGKRRPWYKQEQRAPSPFLCTYMGRGANDKRPFRFILNRSCAVATNLYLMLYPRGALAAMLRRQPCLVDDIHELLGLVTGHELRGEGRVYGGGLHKIEPGELGRISARGFVDRWPELAAGSTGMSTPGLFT